MLRPIGERWTARRAPRARVWPFERAGEVLRAWRQARKAQRRREWDEAISEAASHARRHGPSPTEAYTDLWVKWRP
jgi:hypothetical protein